MFNRSKHGRIRLEQRSVMGQVVLQQSPRRTGSRSAANSKSSQPQLSVIVEPIAVTHMCHTCYAAWHIPVAFDDENDEGHSRQLFLKASWAALGRREL